MPEIDNHALLDENKEVHSFMRERKDYVFVNEFIWQILHLLYKGGPEIKFKLKNSIIMVKDSFELPPLGIKNEGNFCFLNATL